MDATLTTANLGVSTRSGSDNLIYVVLSTNSPPQTQLDGFHHRINQSLWISRKLGRAQDTCGLAVQGEFAHQLAFGLHLCAV